MNLKGRVALVTGASRGIGRAAALELAGRGADVALLATTRESLEQVAAEVEALGRRALVLVCDVRNMFLASEDVSFITGATIDVNGGMLMS